jgi:phage gpG-like protein
MSTALLQLQAAPALALVRGVEEAASDASAFMKDSLLVMIRSAQLNFEAGGRPRWTDHAESTERRRFRKGMKGKNAKKMGSLAVLGGLLVLRDTGRLGGSVGLGQSGAFDTGDGFGESDEFTAAIGTNAPGWQNQFDDTRGWREAREFLLFQDQDAEDITQMGLDWFMRTGPYASLA